jgi:hypothetical protein
MVVDLKLNGEFGIENVQKLYLSEISKLALIFWSNNTFGGSE